MSSYSGKGQQQYGADSQAVSDMSGGKSAGGMRGLGLIAFVLGQLGLQRRNLALAKDYYKTNKQDFDFFTSTHQAPMAESAQEAFDPVANPAYLQDKFASVPAAAARVAEVDRKWLVARRSLSRYATGAGQRLDYEYAKLRAQQLTANWFLGWRGELNYARAHNERAFSRKVMVTNIGVGAGNSVSRGLASAAGNLSNAYAGQINQFGHEGGKLAAQLGVAKGKQDVQDTYKQIAGNQNG